MCLLVLVAIVAATMYKERVSPLGKDDDHALPSNAYGKAREQCKILSSLALMLPEAPCAALL